MPNVELKVAHQAAQSPSAKVPQVEQEWRGQLFAGQRIRKHWVQILRIAPQRATRTSKFSAGAQVTRNRSDEPPRQSAGALSTR
jgi:hypothetical protein